jgi:hypothetical protein
MEETTQMLFYSAILDTVFMQIIKRENQCSKLRNT